MPDGKQIAYLRVQADDTEVMIRNLDDGTERLIGEIATQIGDWTGDPGPLIGNLGPAWTPDGSNLIVADFFPERYSAVVPPIPRSPVGQRWLFCSVRMDGAKRLYTAGSAQEVG